MKSSKDEIISILLTWGAIEGLAKIYSTERLVISKAFHNLTPEIVIKALKNDIEKLILNEIEINKGENG